jgi:[acyl-carrier-protein] S-malonyltransferase
MAQRAIVFAGQGAQFVGMGRDLAERFPECREAFDTADRVLGYPLSRTCFEGPVEALTRSDRCQPAIFVTSVACWRALLARAPGLDYVGAAGLSLGEWTALCVAGMVSFEDALRTLEARGRFMQEACEETRGGMVSVIGLDARRIGEICQATGVEVANLNSPEQTVLSGPVEAIAGAENLAKQSGAKRTVILNVAGAFHSRLMASAGRRLEDVLRDLRIEAGTRPVVANVTGTPHGAPAEVRREMVRQVTSPVQWVSCVEWFRRAGVTEYIELGPGRVLAGLIKRTDPSAKLLSVQDCDTLEKAVQAL